MSMPEITDKGHGVTKTGEDPDRHFEDLLSKELLQLSLKDRNSIQEEVHGVTSMAPEETPRLVEESLRKLAIELDENIPESQKRAYILSQQRPASKAFVNSRDFRLRFLRCELFDYKLAAERIARVCGALLSLFGWYALERPIRLSDFSTKELKAIRKGRVQTLPFRDRSGRRIAIMFPGVDSGEGNTESRNLQIKVTMYMSWAIGSEVEDQRRGLVWLVWFDSKLASSIISDVARIKSGPKSHSFTMIRISAIHICSPDTPFYRVQRSIMSLGIGPWRKRLISHLGEVVELRYILNGFGIDTDTLPISWTGNVKVSYLKQWLRIRQCLDDPSLHAHESCDCSTITNSNQNGCDHLGGEFSRPVECPRLTDILFKKGKSAKNHPGNISFRNQIQIRYELERSRLATGVTSVYQYGTRVFEEDTTSSIVKSLVDFYVEEVRRGNLRALLWNEKQSWWSILADERSIRKKIEKTVTGCIESASLPRVQVTQQNQGLFQPKKFVDTCNKSVKDFAQTLSQGEGNRSKRRKVAHNNISFGDFRDSEGECITQQCFW